jgi:hypothetical protein
MRQALDLRQLNFGDTLSRSFALFTRNALGYTRWMLLVYLLPMLGLHTWLYFLMEPYAWVDRPGAEPGIFDLDTRWAQYTWLTTIAGVLLATSVAAAGIYYLTARLYVGASPSLGELFRALKARVGHLTGISFLHIAACAGLIAGAYAIPALMGLDGNEVGGWLMAILVCTPALVLIMAWYLGRWGLNRAVVMLDDAETTDAFQRSSYLTERFRWRLFGLGFVIMLLVGAPGIPGLLSAPGIVAKALATEGGWHLAADLLMVAWSGLLLPVFFIAPVVYYFDMRCRKESYDLAVMARNFGIEEAEMLRHRMNPGMGYYPPGYTGDRGRRERKPATRRLAAGQPAAVGAGPAAWGPKWPGAGVGAGVPPQPQWQTPGPMPQPGMPQRPWPQQQPQWPTPQQPQWPAPQQPQQPQWPAPQQPQQPQWPAPQQPPQQQWPAPRQPQWPAPGQLPPAAGPRPDAPPLPKWRPPQPGARP